MKINIRKTVSPKEYNIENQFFFLQDDNDVFLVSVGAYKLLFQQNMTNKNL